MKQILPALLCGTIALASCSSFKSTTKTAKTLDVYGSGVIQRPVIVDLDVKNTKVSATIRRKQGSNIESLKAEAVSEAIKTAGADVLVEPTYTIISEKGTSTVTVTGFPASYRNFRDIKPEDVPLIQAGILHVPKVAEPTTVSEEPFFKKKKKTNK